ncbi:hypothetical protein [Methylobacterium sp.]|uniref:hypothetical protein n=1 Tax=Methylobacterium sp. TaxID=409 RepID=UPI000A89108A|nr:hypothetical protein [Methylobacterium sp.]
MAQFGVRDVSEGITGLARDRALSGQFELGEERRSTFDLSDFDFAQGLILD